MKKTLILIAIAISSFVFPACERQSYSETKMFHDVPKKFKSDNATPAHSDAKPAEKAH